MGDMGDIFRAWDKMKKDNKNNNREGSIRVLTEHSINFEQLSANGHYLIEKIFDFWPATGLFIHRKTRKRGRGIFKLINEIRKTEIK